MEQVDKIIIDSLREIGCDIDEDVVSLNSFSPELSVKIIAKVVKIIKPECELALSLPPGMAQRYAVTTQLAETCTKSLNYKGDLGYQTFLYSNVIELRRLCMFLLERLPKEEKRETSQKNITDRTKLIENEIVKNLSFQMNKPWLLEFQDKSKSQKFVPSNVNWNWTEDGECDEATLEYKDKYQASVFQQSGSNLLPSIIHLNDIRWAREKHPNLFKLPEKLNEIRFKSSSSYEVSLMSTPKKQISEKLEATSEEQSEIPVRKLSETEILEEEIEQLQNQIEVEETQQRGLLLEQEEIREKLSQSVIELEKLNNERKVVERTAMLLDDPESNEQKLLEMIDLSKKKMEKLQTQWEEHKRPLQEQIDLNDNKGSHKKQQIEEIISQIKTVKHKTQTINEDIKFKAQLHKELLEELQSANKNVQRISYTSRIIDIIGSIKKQNDDIDKILGDTREIQKSINTLEGQLSRQFKVTDELLYQVAKKDDFAKRSYRLLISLHTSFNELVKLCESTGAMSRENRDLEEQIENEKGNNIKSNLEQITKDLQEITAECEKLENRIKSLQESNVQ